MATYFEFVYSDYFKTELPSHWQEKRLGFLAEQTKNAFVDGPFGSDLKSEDYLDEGVPLIQLNNIRDGKHILRNMKFISNKKKMDLIRHLALPQDIVIAKMAEPVARAAVVSKEYDEYVIVADCVKLTPNLKLVDLDFLIWAINADCVRENAELVSTGTTRIRINLGELKKLKVPYPTLPEQIKIREYLDHGTAKIDSLIAKQEKLIELLKEKRQAVISNAVTKGLNPDVTMKESGVEWLGQVPEHWGVSTIGYYAKVTNGTTPSKANLSYWDKEEIPWLSSGEVNQYHIVEVSEYITKKALAECSLELLPIGTVVMGMIGQGKTRGLSAITKIEATINQNLAALVTYTKLNNEYLHYYLQAAYNYMREEGRGGNQAALNCEIIRKFPITIPPFKEQLQVIEEIKKLSITYKALINKAESAIELMQERRTALISSAVTGKIDVRNWQQPDKNNEANTELGA